MFDYKLLEAFALVIEEGGFEKAAQKLHLTQSAVSQRIRQLEEQYGQILLQRTSPPRPTQSGLPLLAHYRQVKQLEDDLEHQRQSARPAFATLAVGINADTLATWFPEAVRPFLLRENVVLDLHVDDQERTHELLLSGKVWGCISTRRQPMQGCRATLLGRERYSMFATEEYASRWFTDGLTRDNLARAPMARFNRKDDLNRRMLSRLVGEKTLVPPTFFIPSPEKYAEFLLWGCCWGILPQQQAREFEADGRLCNITPEHAIDVHLYWHCWNLKSALMQRFNNWIIQSAGEALTK